MPLAGLRGRGTHVLVRTLHGGEEATGARQRLVAATAGFAVVVACAITMVVAAPQTGRADGAIGGPFTLVDDNGAPVTEKTLAGKPYVMYFGYTYCPEVCPTTLVDLSRWIKELGPKADKLNYVFVTLDPERDTPKVMHAYLSSFDSHIRGFTGTPEQIAEIAKEYRIYYKKIPTSDGSYSVDHSSIIYLIYADGQFDNVIAYQEKDAAALAKLRNLVASIPPS
jgi:protein SCO1/2